MSGAILKAQGLSKAYRSGTRTLDVLVDSNLDVAERERVAIIGPSGVGKSTLLHLLGGLDRPDTGQIDFRGRELQGMGEAELAEYRNRHVGMVFQFYHLLPEFTALENVQMPMLIGRDDVGARDRAAGLLEEVGLDGRMDHYPSELSGGERQRVAIARALARGPELLLADEPTGNLDQDNGARVLELFLQLHERHRNAIVMVTHNPELVRGFDRVLRMEPHGQLRPNEAGRGEDPREES